MNTNDTSDLARASVGQRLASLSRFRTSAILLVVLIVLLVGPGAAISSTIPTISIPLDGVVMDQTVSITTYNYPANQDFVVTMGPMGSMGIDGYYVTTINSGVGGSFPATFTIPDQLKGSYQIAIRLQSAQGYYSYNWFYNNTTGQGGQPGYTGIPTFKVVSVNQDQNVTVETHNFPANETFTWTMGPMGTRGINGIVVDPAWSSGNGGSMTATFNIPPELYGSYQVSFRAQTGHTYPLIPYYAYNWFYNNTAGTGGQPVQPIEPPPSYSGVPTFKVCTVVKNGQVTIHTNNFPPNQIFNVTMGPMGTAGINGISVGKIDSGAGGSFDASFPIPAELHGHSRISIRAQTGQAYPYYAYNWFYNNDASVCN